MESDETLMSENCIFCKIGRGELPSYKIHENTNYITFMDIYPPTFNGKITMPVVHVITKKHLGSNVFEDLNEKEMFRKLGIDALLLFGSHAQGTATAMSDVDIGVILTPPALANTPERRHIYDVLYDFFSEKLQKFVTIDIVFLHDAPMELQSHVATHSRALYERTPDIFVRFRERVFDAYADFAPLRHIFHTAILARIPSSV